jgi:hypothetical protein
LLAALSINQDLANPLNFIRFNYAWIGQIYFNYDLFTDNDKSRLEIALLDGQPQKIVMSA